MKDLDAWLWISWFTGAFHLTVGFVGKDERAQVDVSLQNTSERLLNMWQYNTHVQYSVHAVQ